MIRPIQLICTILLACACQSNNKIAPQTHRITDCLPQNLADSTLFLRPNPITTLTNGQKTRFDQLIQPIDDSTTYTIVVWASWCPPDTLPQDGTPLIMLSIDQCADAWRVAIDQLPTTTAIHAQIDPYNAQPFLRQLGIYGIPHIVRIEP